MNRVQRTFALFIVTTALAASCPAGRADDATREGWPAVAPRAAASRAPVFGTAAWAYQRPPSPCDNAWAGYCLEDLRCREFRYRVGTGYWVPSRTMAPMCGAGAGVRAPLIPMFRGRGWAEHAVPLETTPGVEAGMTGNDAGQAVPKESDWGPAPLPPPPPAPPLLPAARDALSEPPPLPDTPVSAPPDQAGVSWE